MYFLIDKIQITPLINFYYQMLSLNLEVEHQLQLRLIIDQGGKQYDQLCLEFGDNICEIALLSDLQTVHEDVKQTSSNFYEQIQKNLNYLLVFTDDHVKTNLY